MKPTEAVIVAVLLYALYRAIHGQPAASGGSVYVDNSNPPPGYTWNEALGVYQKTDSNGFITGIWYNGMAG